MGLGVYSYRMRLIVIMALTITFSVLGFACTDRQELSLIEQRTQDINRLLMCPICPGESIDQSQNNLAKQMRGIVKEQVESLGAKFVEVKTEDADEGVGDGGYAKETSEEYKQKQSQLIKETIAKAKFAYFLPAQSTHLSNNFLIIVTF